jgi:hypothetical protein
MNSPAKIVSMARIRMTVPASSAIFPIIIECLAHAAHAGTLTGPALPFITAAFIKAPSSAGDRQHGHTGGNTGLSPACMSTQTTGFRLISSFDFLIIAIKIIYSLTKM